MSDLGLDAYADDSTDAADLLLNLEGCTVHRFSPGTGEHAGTALMVVELPTGEGLGMQVTMNPDGEHIHTFSVTQRGGTWQADEMPTTRTLDDIETDCPDLTIHEVVHHDIMDPDNARVVAILDAPGTDPYGIDIHIHDDGGTEFFEVDL